MIIRKMIIEDIPELAMLYMQFWNENSCIEKMQKQFRKMQHSDTHILLSAVEESRLIGSVMGIVCEELYGDCRPFLVIENMIVDKNCRKKGIGKALFLEVERIANERNCTQIILVTETDRLDACSFYESVGFKPTANKGYKKKL
ncbi:GNAT family N-acetyltransferase [Clostridium sp. DJ247]|uniref:GNAT family N-acetyltransferase n=1 Tax=Clostridium sp. DJ247 TaxID=2726188 RepID=UPI001623B7F5|nr:GNAT family N-acetyltransferase [Clostridium sp. DJ247]MBC2581667.1 GNAT family N-acetyltransferase [Clostridium sp. DJ247]